MRLKIIILLYLISFFLPGNRKLLFAQENIYQEMDLQQLVDQALENNPDYLSAQNRWQSAKMQIPQQGSLPDPQLAFAVLNLPVNSFAFDQEPMTAKRISIMQMFPFPGKLGQKENIADFQAKIIEQQAEELKNNLIKKVKTTYYELFFVDKSIEIVEKNKALLQQFVKVAETKYSVGKGLQYDVLKAQVELSKLIDRLISLQQKRKNLEFRLNNLLNRDVNSPLGRIKNIDKSILNLTPGQLRRLGSEHSPFLKGWRSAVEKAKSAGKLAKLSYWPDWTLGAAYSQRNDLSTGMQMHDFFSAEISVNIPLYFYRKQSKKIEETQINLKSVEEKYTAIKNEVYFQIENAFVELEKNARLINLYKTGIIPQATQAMNSSLSAYQVDKVDFLTLLNSQMTLLNYEMDYYRVLTNHEKGLAELEAFVGKDL
jgi:outer membrane protein TolC